MRRFIFALALCCAGPVLGAKAVFLDRLDWFEPHEKFGGYSGIEVSDDGLSFTVISDKGHWTIGNFIRTNTRLIDATHTALRPILDTKSKAVDRHGVDSEGLALAADGAFYVSFEAQHRVWKYEVLSGPGQRTNSHKAFPEFQNNSGLEALAIDKDGVLYTLPERSGEWERPFPVYRYKQGKWAQHFTIARRGKYLPVGADFGPEGWLYLLERDFVWYRGFSSRIRRFQVTENGFENEEILLTSRFGNYDNLEGISVWQTPTGEIRLTTIADNNFNAFQKTEFVEFVVVTGEKP